MKRNGNSEATSSFDMLLDTMCNTFGGTIFLAIALIIIAAMLKPDFSATEEQNARTATALAGEIAALELEAQSIASEVNLKKEIIKRAKNDPRLDLFVKMATMNDRNRTLKGQLQIEQLKLQQVVLAREAKQAVQNQIDEQLKQQRETSERLQQQLAAIQSDLAKIKTVLNKPATSITLNKMQKVISGEVPYFIIAKSGMLWRIGPDLISPIVINKDVASTFSHFFYKCDPVSGKGTPILSGEAVSQDAIKLLTSLPPKRYPVFQVYPDCAMQYHRLVELLKIKSLPYATSTKQAETFAGFMISSKAEYER